MKKKYADMDPLEEIRAIREEISREFKNVLELGEYLREKAPRQNRKSPSKSEERPLSPRRKKTAKV